MGRRLLGFIVLIAVLISGFLWWRRQNDTEQAANGDVHCVGCMTPAERLHFLKENVGETEEAPADHRSKTAREDAAELRNSAPGPTGTSDVAANGSTVSGMQPRSSAVALTSNADSSLDTLPPDAQNGSHFAGSGPYQWYRQGDITWRLNTATGRSCIVYATLEEWRKSIVRSHGCGRNA